MRIGLLSDTHGFLDEAIFEYFAECDEIWHAGDFGPATLFDQLKAFKPLRGVYGNIDGAEVRACTVRDLQFESCGLRVYITHIGGYPGHYEKHARTEILQYRPGLFICGHSHILKVMRDPALELIHLNPGAAGHTGWHLMRTALRFEVEAGRLHAMEAIELDRAVVFVNLPVQASLLGLKCGIFCSELRSMGQEIFLWQHNRKPGSIRRK